MAEGPDYIDVAIEPMVPDDGLDCHLDTIRTGLLIRRTEQRLLQLFSEGKLFGTVHTCIGQEFVGVAVIAEGEEEAAYLDATTDS